MTWKEPDIDLAKIKSALRPLYLDGLSRNKTGRIAGHGTAMTATIASRDPSSNVCCNCGNAPLQEEQPRRACQGPRTQ